jgi:uridine kinase
VKIVLIAGGTASGKSTLCRTLAARPDVLLIEHDRYYKSASPGANFDEPAALDTALLIAQLAALRQGEAVDLPIYDFARHARADGTDRAVAAPIVVVEGILVLCEPALRAVADLSVFVDAPADLRLARRLRRDLIERGRSAESVLNQYLATVRPMHNRWVEPAKAHAHLVLDGEQPPEQLLAQLDAALAGL